VVVSKYFYGEQNTSERETSVRQLIHRVCRTIADWGIKDGYFSKADGEVFYDELTWLCVNQYGAFNSPVWFNVGLYHQYGIGKNSAKGNWFWDPRTGQAERAPTQYEYPQGSACFIQSVEDNMESIMHLAYSEAMLFKYGSGTGTDLTPIRSSREKLSGGGRPSGPMSLLKVYDSARRRSCRESSRELPISRQASSGEPGHKSPCRNPPRFPGGADSTKFPPR
jgi:ribonucleoside-diphosphate reductase alpha chain